MGVLEYFSFRCGSYVSCTYVGHNTPFCYAYQFILYLITYEYNSCVVLFSVLDGQLILQLLYLRVHVTEGYNGEVEKSVTQVRQ